MFCQWPPAERRPDFSDFSFSVVTQKVIYRMHEKSVCNLLEIRTNKHYTSVKSICTMIERSFVKC